MQCNDLYVSDLPLPTNMQVIFTTKIIAASPSTLPIWCHSSSIRNLIKEIRKVQPHVKKNGDKRRRIGFWNHSWTTFHHVYEQYFFITIFQPLCFRYRRPHMQVPSSPMWLRKAESHSLPIAACSLMIETTKKACCHQVYIMYRFFRSQFFCHNSIPFFGWVIPAALLVEVSYNQCLRMWVNTHMVMV